VARVVTEPANGVSVLRSILAGVEIARLDIDDVAVVGECREHRRNPTSGQAGSPAEPTNSWVGAHSVGLQDIDVQASLIREVVKDRTSRLLPQQLLACLDVSNDARMQRHHLTRRKHWGDTPHSRLPRPDASAASEFVDGLALPDSARDLDRVDRRAGMTTGPATPAFDASPVLRDGDRGMHVIVISCRTSPSGRPPLGHGRSAQLIEQGSQVNPTQ
jgi:hypothetical protein